MSKERFEWLYNETMLKHYMVDNQNNIQLGYEAIVNLLNQQNKRIADLEAKLAEKRQDCVALDKAWNNLNNQLSIKNDEINELKQQLAEKETRIAELEDKDWYEETIKQLEEQNGRLIEKRDQDKISFAVEQLEKVKTNILSNITFGIESVGIMNSIDNQIKQLKERE